MALNYQSGEEIRKGDRVLINGHEGEIEFVADPLIVDPATQWYVDEFGSGVMVIEPKIFGRLFTSGDDDDLEFVGRVEG